jgi:hypothetical protein
MASPLPNTAPRAEVWPWRLLALLLIVGSAGVRLVYLADACPLDLAPDEAHYWDWSRHLDWSYYSKGPLIAYLIRAGCALAGDWSQRLTATEMVAVRLPAVLCGSLLLVSLYILTVQVLRRERLALAVVALALTLPLIAAGASLMTIDAPYTCCWGWALVLGWEAIRRRSTAWWAATGFVVGVGILAKYTMVLWLPSVALFLLTSPEHRSQLWRRGFWIMLVVTGVCCLPILVWNLQHDWVTVRHVNRLAGAGNGLHWDGPLEYVGTQCALLLGFWFAAWVAAMIAHRPWIETDDRLRYLWWLSAPMFGVFLAFSVQTGGGEPNWPVTTYVSGLVLTAGWLARQIEDPRRWYRRLTIANISAACVIGLTLTVVIHHTNWLYPLLGRLSGPPTDERPMPLRRYDPTCRLRGWQTLAAEVDRLRSQLHDRGIDAVVAGASWALPGELGFYCAGHPPVYSVGPALGDRCSQYDLWHPNPIADPGHFAGRTFIVVGAFGAALDGAFDRIEPSQIVVHSEDGQPLASWPVTVCHGFHGFPKLEMVPPEF